MKVVRAINNISDEIKNHKFIWLYYVLMMLLLVSWTDHTSAPPEMYRYAFMALLFIPLFFDRRNITLFVLICFYTVGLYGIGYSYMPNRSIPYMIILAFLVLTHNKKNAITFRGWGAIVLFGVYTIIVDIIGLSSFSGYLLLSESRKWTIMIILLLPFFLSNNRVLDTEKISFAFIIAALIMSLQFFLLGGNVAASYDYHSGIDRIAWMDPNYFCPVLGMGIILSMMTLIEKKTNLIFKVLLIATIILSFVAVVMSASRGSLIAVAVSVAVVVFFSRIKKRYKLLIIIVLAVFIVVIYNMGYFDLLEYRLEGGTNSTSGSGRYQIWTMKLNAFFRNINVLSLLFGVGFDGGFYLGSDSGLGFHNDFLAFFCCYGLVGIISFFYILFRPVFLTPKKYRSHVLASAIFLAAVGLTVEPMCNLYLPYWFFLFYIYCKASSYAINNH